MPAALPWCRAKSAVFASNSSALCCRARGQGKQVRATTTASSSTSVTHARTASASPRTSQTRIAAIQSARASCNIISRECMSLLSAPCSHASAATQNFTAGMLSRNSVRVVHTCATPKDNRSNPVAKGLQTGRKKCLRTRSAPRKRRASSVE